MKAKKWTSLFLFFTLLSLSFVAITNYIVDPYFHYRKPDFFSYTLFDERYQNDGITRQFEYDTIITGTSMCQNFKASECDNLFNCNSIKICYSGASYKEINDSVSRAIHYNKNIQRVIRGLDLSFLSVDKDLMCYNSYPKYLYNDSILDDINYLLNGKTFINSSCRSLLNTITQKTSTDFDSYSNWDIQIQYGKDYALADLVPTNSAISEQPTSEELIERTKNNIIQNVTSIAQDNPQVEFYYFIPPYSIGYWYQIKSTGGIGISICTQRILIEECLKHPNIHLFSWCDDLNITADLNNYKDLIHYASWVNSYILEQMNTGSSQLTEINYNDYLDSLNKAVSEYDYSTLFN